MVIPHAPFKTGRGAGRFDTADEPRRGERVEGVIHGLKGDDTHAIAYPRGDRRDAKVVTLPHRLQECYASGRRPQTGTA